MEGILVTAQDLAGSVAFPGTEDQVTDPSLDRVHCQEGGRQGSGAIRLDRLDHQHGVAFVDRVLDRGDGVAHHAAKDHRVTPWALESPQ